MVTSSLSLGRATAVLGIRKLGRGAEALRLIRSSVPPSIQPPLIVNRGTAKVPLLKIAPEATLKRARTEQDSYGLGIFFVS